MMLFVERAQETFKRMMKEQVAPALRVLGFKGSGQSFELPSETHWALIGFQRSAFSDAREVRFTINLTVVSKKAWDEVRAERPYLGGARPSPNVMRGAPVWSDRIGKLLPHGRDQWWLVPAGVPTAPVAAEVVAAIRDYALPEIQLQIAGAPSARPPLGGTAPLA